MKHKINIGYIGFSLKVIKDIAGSKGFNLSCILCERGGIRQAGRRQEIIGYARENGLPYFEFENSNELFRLVNEMKGVVDQYLVYECNVIIGAEVINSVSLYNLHPGDLRTNRGCHPIHWCILEGMERTYMTLYKITPKIDLGVVIGTFSTVVCSNDTYSSLRERLEGAVGQLLVCLHSFITGELDDCEEITHGIYRRKIGPSDYILDLVGDSLTMIQAKIRAQSAYGGAVLCHGGHTYRVRAAYVDRDQAALGARETDSVLKLPAKVGTLYAIAMMEGEE